MTTDTANDVTTLAGFTAQFDAEVRKLQQIHGWCDEGRSRAYRETGINPDDPYAGVPLSKVGDAMLTDAGRQARAAQEQARLDELKNAAIELCRRGLADGYGSQESLGAALNALGIPGTFQDVTKYNHYGTWSTVTDSRLGPATVTKVSAAIEQAVKDALTAEGITIAAGRSIGVSIDQRRRTSGTQWVTT